MLFIFKLKQWNEKKKYVNVDQVFSWRQKKEILSFGEKATSAPDSSPGIHLKIIRMCYLAISM